MTRRTASYQQDQKKFNDVIAWRHLDSLPFFASVRNSVAKQEFYRSRPKQVKKDLMGRVLGRVSASIETREQLARIEANRALLSVSEGLTRGDLRLSWDDDSLRAWADAKAKKCEEFEGDENWLFKIECLVESYGFQMPSYTQKDFFFGDFSDVMRACNNRWWLRQARVAKVRAIDQLARAFKMVHAKAQPYVSNEAVKLRRAQVRRNRATLEGFEAINQEGQAYTLAELSDLSVSNPTNRRHELMVRMRGFEELADFFGMTGLFITLSAPSRFHPMRQIKNARGRLVRVVENPNYEGGTPRDAQDWLNKTWQLIRAEFARENIGTFGFRVVEPHSDGCPHWHQLLFFSPDEIQKVKSIFKEYSLRTDSQEKGADEYRLKIVLIDKSKGSAAGYIAKYICKSIDGSHIDADLLGNSGVTAAERICAWASAWGIRQFQQIGGGSVTVWRELRRLDSAEGITEEARAFADSGDWAAYCLLQGNGSPFVSRDAAPIQAAYWQEVNASTGEIITSDENQYGEKSPGKLFGLFDVEAGKHYLSRFYSWTIQRVGAAVKAVVKAFPVSDLSEDDLLDLMRGDGLGSIA